MPPASNPGATALILIPRVAVSRAVVRTRLRGLLSMKRTLLVHAGTLSRSGRNHDDVAATIQDHRLQRRS
jgi:hypothetical protein